MSFAHVPTLPQLTLFVAPSCAWCHHCANTPQLPLFVAPSCAWCHHCANTPNLPYLWLHLVHGAVTVPTPPTSPICDSILCMVPSLCQHPQLTLSVTPSCAWCHHCANPPPTYPICGSILCMVPSLCQPPPPTYPICGSILRMVPSLCQHPQLPLFVTPSCAWCHHCADPPPPTYPICDSILRMVPSLCQHPQLPLFVTPSCAWCHHCANPPPPNLPYLWLHLAHGAITVPTPTPPTYPICGSILCMVPSLCQPPPPNLPYMWLQLAHGAVTVPTPPTYPICGSILCMVPSLCQHPQLTLFVAPSCAWCRRCANTPNLPYLWLHLAHGAITVPTPLTYPICGSILRMVLSLCQHPQLTLSVAPSCAWCCHCANPPNLPYLWLHLAHGAVTVPTPPTYPICGSILRMVPSLCQPPQLTLSVAPSCAWCCHCANPPNLPYLWLHLAHGAITVPTPPTYPICGSILRMVPSLRHTMSVRAPGKNWAIQPRLPMKKQALMKKRMRAGYRLAFFQSITNVSWNNNKLVNILMLL